MGNHHSHSGVESRLHSNNYNISTNNQAVLSRGPNNNIKSLVQNETTTTIEILPKADNCVCSNLKYTDLEHHHDAVDSSSPACSYELVKIGTPVKRNSSSKRRASYSWRKIQHEVLHNNKLQQQQNHHPDCPAHSPSTSAQPVANPEEVMSVNSLQKFSKQLVTLSGTNGKISKATFQKYVLPHCRILSEYMWSYFNDFTACSNSKDSFATVPAINEQKFFRAADKIYSYITDKDQIQFWFKVFGKGRELVDRDDFKMFLLCAYQLSTTKANTITQSIENINDLDGIEWIEAVTKSCFHIKDEMSIIFLSNWTLNNLPRILIPLHKYVIHQFTTGCTQLNAKIVPNDVSQSPVSNNEEKGPLDILKTPVPVLYTIFCEDKLGSVSTINPVLLWLLTCSLPPKYISSLIKKAETKQNQLTTLTPKQFILQMINNATEPDSWTLLYNSEEHGSSVNRFQFHVFHYRGPTLMLVSADNGYKVALAYDTEWKESCHFWGSDDSSIFQLAPEFRLVEKGKNIMYANFSIRGYPFGIQAGKDPRNVTVEINPDFQYISFKKIPCKIESILVYGCAQSQAKITQTEYKKWEAKECEKQKKVPLNPGEWYNNPDKYLLELAGSYQDYGHGK